MNVSDLAQLPQIKLGLCGFGTVGRATYELVERNQNEIARRLGCRLQITHIATRELPNDIENDTLRWSQDVFAVVNDPEIQIVIELIGGMDTAYALIMAAISAGKHVITANKALIAEQGKALFEAAAQQQVIIAYEAAVAGGIPIIKALREGLAANQIQWISGIINGTGNYILTHMLKNRRTFEDVLCEAQQLGYAEADPTFDIEGIDAAHKITILAALAFGVPLQFQKAYTEGISKITTEDVEQADHLGYVIKHLGITRRTDKGIELRVHPTLIKKERLLANVNGVQNAVEVYGDALGSSVYYGAGAGGAPTASAVVADIIDVVREMHKTAHERVPYLAFNQIEQQAARQPILSIEHIVTAYYLRLKVLDEPGVLAKVAFILGQEGISIESMIQKDAEQNQMASLIMLTHETQEASMNLALQQLHTLPEVQGDIMRIRIDNLTENFSVS